MTIKGRMIIGIKRAWVAARWKKRNTHNFTSVEGIFPIEKITVGKGTYGTLHIEYYGNPCAGLTIGNFCSIAREVRFLLDGGHMLQNASLYPFRVRYGGEHAEAMTKGPIVIHDDVWIGERCLILSGVEIGQGAVIGAGTVVAKNVPPYAVYCNGRIIKYRFDKEISAQMSLFDFGKVTEEDLKSNIREFYLSGEQFISTKIYHKYKKQSS